MKDLKRIIIPIVLCVLCISVSAQLTGSKNFLQLPYKYDFCLENYEISMPVPENWGFQVPFLNEKEAVLTLRSKEVRYSLSLDSINKSSSVLFALPDDKTPCLELRMTAFGNEQSDESTISSKYGNFHKVDQSEEEKVESYQNISDYKVLTFRILTKDEKVKEICREIIASCKTDYGYYSPYSSDYVEPHSIQYYAKDSTYYPEMGLTFVIPFDASATIYAPEININDATTLLTAYTSLSDMAKVSEAGHFWTSGFDMKYQFIKRNSDLELNWDELSGLSESYSPSCVRNFDYSVAEIPSKVYVYGSESVPTIVTITPVKDYSVVFTFSNVTAGNMAKVEDFISRIHISDVQKEGISTAPFEARKLGELVNIQNMGLGEKLKDISLDKNVSLKNTKIIECTIPEASAKLAIPYLSYVQVYPDNGESIEEKKGKYEVSLKKDPNSETGGLEFYAGLVSTSDRGDYCLLWLPINEDNLTAEQYLSKEAAIYECQNDYNVERLGTCNIKGHRWYVMSINNSSMSSYKMDYFITEHKGMLIEIRVIKTDSLSDSSEIDMTKIVESLLYKASFKD